MGVLGTADLSSQAMLAKLIAYDEEARAHLKRGIDALADAVSTTLGPKGRNVALDKKFGAPTVTHDGVTVARDIQLWILETAHRQQPALALAAPRPGSSSPPIP